MCLGLSAVYGLWKTYWRLRRDAVSRSAQTGRQQLVLQADLARPRRVEAHDRPGERRLPRPRLPDERQALLLPQLEGDPVQHGVGAVGGLDPTDREQRRRRRGGLAPDAPLRRIEARPLELAGSEAGDRMTGLELDGGGLGFRARGSHLGAARREDAAHGAPAGPRDVPRDRREGAPARDVRDRGDQPARVRVPRANEERLRRAGLDEAPGVHDEHPPGKARDRGEVVADVDGRRPRAPGTDRARSRARAPGS